MAIQTIRPPARYSDMKVNLDSHPVKRDLTLNTNEDAITRSLKNLLFTDPGERFFQPDLGAGVKRHLFENFTPLTAIEIEDEIRTVVGNYEPRAILQSVEVVDKPDYNSLEIKIVYRTINNIQPVELRQIIKRVR